RFVDHGASLDQAVGKPVRIAIKLARGLNADSRLPLRGLRKQIERPNDAVRGRLVTGGDESQHVRSQLDLAQALTALRIARSQEERQNVVRHSIRIFREPPSPPRDDFVDGRFEGRQHPAYAPAPGPRQRAWESEQIEGVDAAEVLEVILHPDADLLGMGAEPVRKDGTLEHLQGQPRDFYGKIHDLSVPPPQPFGERARHFDNGAGEAHDIAWREKRCKHATLYTPAGAV